MPPEPTRHPAKQDAFTVKERVAIGTAGVVYRAVQESTGREVTFKVLSEDASNPLEPSRVLALRWRIEALKHPTIAEFIDAYDDPDGFVIVTSWLEGGTGGNDFPSKQRVLTKAEARLVAVRFCGALLAAEQARFPHGDLKPSNVILADRKGEGLVIQIQDWGLSSCREFQPPETMQFMAPERLHGHPPSVQGDLFTAAATLWFLLTGAAPVPGEAVEELLTMWGDFDAGSLAQERPDLDDHFRQWLAWLLRWQPGDRPQSAAQALDVLNQCVTYAASLEAQEKAQAQAAASLPATAPAPQPAAPPRTGPARPAVRLPQSPSPPLRGASQPATKTTVKQPPDEPKATAGQRFMLAVMMGCLIGGVGVLFVWWAENKWGTEWKKVLADRWDEVWEKSPPPTPAPAAKAVPAKPAPGTAKPPQSRPVAKPAAKPPVKLATDNFAYAISMNLDGASGGTGWQGPWKATAATIAESPDKKNRHVRFGGGERAAFRRDIGPSAKIAGEGICILLTFWHPGADGPTVEFDLLDTGDGKSPAPIMVQPQGDKLRISVKGGTDVIETPAAKNSVLALKWTFKPSREAGKKEVEAQVFLNPDPNNKKSPIADVQSCRRVLPGSTLPPMLAVSVRTTAPSGKPASIRDLRIAPTIVDALK